MEIEMKAIGTGSCVRTVADNQVSLPVSQHPESPEVENGLKSYPPSPLLWAPVSREEQVEAVENSHHVIPIPEIQTCRICDPDEDERDDVLVELGCSCRGEMSRMHRKCILEWYGTRMLLQSNYQCEICKALLPMETQAVVADAVSDHENGGRATLMAALKSQLAPFVWMPDIESATNYDELVELLTAAKAELFERLQERTVNGEISANEVVAEPGCRCSWAMALTVGTIVVLVGGYTWLLHHFFGSGFH